MALYDPAPRSSEIDLQAAAERLHVSVVQAANLYALARGLLSLPDDYEHFDMETFFVSSLILAEKSLPPEKSFDPIACGAVACALGHAPTFCGEPPEYGETWASYGYRVLGVRPMFSIPGLNPETEDYRVKSLWSYFFDGGWAFKDNTPRGAGQRILRALRRGPPMNFDAFDFADFQPDYLEETL